MNDDQVFIEEGSKMIKTAARKLEATLLDTPSGKWLLKLTPESIKRMAKITFFIPRAIIPIDIDKDLTVLDSHQVIRYEKTSTIHLYEGGVKFPASKISGDPPAIIELTMQREILYKREMVQKPGESNRDFAERDARIREAYGHDRYWFAVPSSLAESIHFKQTANGSYAVLISDREYARRFAEFNDLEDGVWQCDAHRSKLALAIGLAILIWVGGCLLIFASGLLDQILGIGGWGVGILFGIWGLLSLIAYLLIKFIPKKNVEPL